MQIKRIDPTPSPNTLKITLDVSKNNNKSITYNEVSDNNPEFINALLQIEDIQSIFQAMDFISVDKNPRSDWEMLLPQIKRVFDQSDEMHKMVKETIDSGEKTVEVLHFKNIPYQIKVTSHENETRKQLDVRFIDAMLNSQNDDDNVILLRKWVDFGVRYGTNEEIVKTVKDELDALYTDERLAELVVIGQENKHEDLTKRLSRVSVETYLNTEDWKARYRMLDAYPKPDESDIEFFKIVLNDEAPQLRRLAVMFLGMIEDKSVLPLLHHAMNDKNIAVRRTSGDTLSDFGFKESLPVMHDALSDKSPIVRWRAAMFIYDEGDETSLPYLKAHLDDAAFEVRLQVKMAYERIMNGEKAVGSVWKQISNRNKGE
ncbi:conserved virulence factor C family protein [Macrococcus armenti]|uniref:conserved virulence factor C family protein n=1 Tax=Macrococcus armenti TaxID=2875764 RepID=UPI001CCD374D|nr:virulence factor [Macrococcus armenti]UBH14363.1 virulence factor [Macrococcus armenti]UBH16723.1 virulence factor [Macrococcus armenti]UBH18986.1 virulence factor [Macrococcus armenti]